MYTYCLLKVIPKDKVPKANSTNDPYAAQCLNRAKIESQHIVSECKARGDEVLWHAEGEVCHICHNRKPLVLTFHCGGRSYCDYHCAVSPFVLMYRCCCVVAHTIFFTTFTYHHSMAQIHEQNSHDSASAAKTTTPQIPQFSPSTTVPSALYNAPVPNAPVASRTSSPNWKRLAKAKTVIRRVWPCQIYWNCAMPG